MEHRSFYGQRYILSFGFPAVHGLAILCMVLLVPWRAFAHATVSSTASVTNINRAGANISGESYFSSQIAQNLFADPGFEFPVFGIAIPVTSTRGTTEFLDNYHPTGDPTGFWSQTGNTCTVRVGTCSDGSNKYCWANTTTSGCSGVSCNGGCASGTCDAGTTFTLSAFSSSSGTDAFTCTPGSASNGAANCPALAASGTVGPGWPIHNIVGCRVQVTSPSSWSAIGPIGGASNWAGSYHASNTSDLFLTSSEAYQGKASLELTGGGSFTYLWDNVPAGQYLPSTCASPDQAYICSTNSDCPNSDCLLSGNQQYASHPIVGSNWQFSFWATGSGTCNASLSRAGGNTDFTTSQATWTISSSTGSSGSAGSDRWNQYSYSFTGADSTSSSPSSQSGDLNFTFSCPTGTVYIDNIFLGKTTGVANSNFKTEVLQDLQGMNVGSVRSGGYPFFASSEGLTEAMEAGDMYTGGIPTGGAESTGVYYGNVYTDADLVALAAAVSSTTSPQFSIPPAWPDADYQALANQLCTWESTYNFPHIWIECGNENWTAGGDSAGLQWWEMPGDNQSYGAACARAFSLTSSTISSCSNATATTNAVNYIADDQPGNPASPGVQADQSPSSTVMFPNSTHYGWADNLYIGPDSLTSSTSISAAIGDIFSLFSGIFNTGSSGMTANYNQRCHGISSPTCNQFFDAYEWSIQAGQNTTGINTLSSEINVGYGGAALVMADMIEALTYLPSTGTFITANQFTLAQANDGHGSDQWGMTPGNYGTNKDFAPAWPWLRSGGLAEALYNSTVQGNYYAISGLPSGVYGAAFCHTGQAQCKVALANSNSSSTAVSITFPSGTAAPTAGKTVLYTYGMGDNNEASNSVYIGSLPGGVSQSGKQVSFTAPAFSAVALLAGTSRSPTPTISANLRNLLEQ
jgi:hypothetical protein